jgi:cobalt-zinc-cadmium efflux system membrane fusion protein
MRGTSSRGVWNELDGLLIYGAAGHQSDQELLDRFVARRDEAGEAAFAALVVRYGPMVLGVCRRVLGDRHEAEDAFQATFLVLARKAASIERPEQLANWLFGVACRTALDAGARARRQRARERRGRAMSGTQIKPAADDQPVLDELRGILDEELARLPERYRGALVVCELDGLPRRAAARRLGIPEGTLSSRLARAKQLLRDRLARRGLVLSALAIDRALSREALARTMTLPLSLTDSAIRAAMQVAAGAALAEAASTSIATLAQGALKAMLVAKLKGIVLGLATMVVVTTGVGVLAQAPASVGAGGAHEAVRDSVVVARPPSRGNPLVLAGSTALDPSRLARIRARFAPVRVVELGRVWDSPQKGRSPEHRELRAGDRVIKGDLLAVLYSADVASKKQDLLNALVQLTLDQQILDRMEKNRHAIPEVIRLNQQRAVQGDRTEVNRALNNLKTWDIPQDEIDVVYTEAKRISADKDAWSKTPEGRWISRENPAAGSKEGRHEEPVGPWGLVRLRAPLDGIIVERNVHMDEVVVENTVNLFQIADTSRLLVIAKCPEDRLSSLEALGRNERRWTVRAGPAGRTALSGTIEEIGYVIDPKQRSAVIKGYIENPGLRMRAGQFVTAAVDIPPPDDVVEIPADAVVDNGRQSLVWVQSDPAGRDFAVRRVWVVDRPDGTVLVRKTPIPKEDQLPADEAEQGLLPKEPLRPGERVLLGGFANPDVLTAVQQPLRPGQRILLRGAEPVEARLNALERKLDQILDAVRSLRRAGATKSDPHERDVPK